MEIQSGLHKELIDQKNICGIVWGLSGRALPVSSSISFTGLGNIRTCLSFWQFSPLAMEEDMLLLVVHNCAQGIGQKVMQGVWWTKMSMADELPGNLT